jgi:hypothetical protein
MALPDKENPLSESDEMVDDAVVVRPPVGEVVDRVDAGTIDKIVPAADEIETGNDSIFSWLIPLLLLVLMVILGFWFCGKSS